MDLQKPIKKSRAASRKDLPDDETKILLAAEVEALPQLWNITDKDYKKRDVTAANWNKVSEKLGLSVNQCKTGWKTLKDALNYRINKKPGKSGDGLDDVEEEEDLLDDQVQKSLEAWKFWDSLKFLKESKPKRCTISTMAEDDFVSSEASTPGSASQSTSTILDESTEGSELGVPSPSSEPAVKRKASNYNYMQNVKRAKDSSEDKIADAITKLVAYRTSASATVPSSTNSRLTYPAQMESLDRMLAKLPESQAEDLIMKFLNDTHQAVKKQEHCVIVQVQNSD